MKVEVEISPSVNSLLSTGICFIPSSLIQIDDFKSLSMTKPQSHSYTLLASVGEFFFPHCGQSLVDGKNLSTSSGVADLCFKSARIDPMPECWIFLP